MRLLQHNVLTPYHNGASRGQDGRARWRTVWSQMSLVSSGHGLMDALTAIDLKGSVILRARLMDALTAIDLKGSVMLRARLMDALMAIDLKGSVMLQARSDGCTHGYRSQGERYAPGTV